MSRRRSFLGQVRRDLYMTQRALGDAQAASHGPVRYAKRIGRRRVTRSVFRSIRRAGLC